MHLCMNWQIPWRFGCNASEGLKDLIFEVWFLFLIDVYQRKLAKDI